MLGDKAVSDFILVVAVALGVVNARLSDRAVAIGGVTAATRDA